MLSTDIQMHLKIMNKIPYVRYKYISKFVYTLLHDNHITSYPINIHELIDTLNSCNYNIQLDTYDSYLSFKNNIQQKRGRPLFKYIDIKNLFGSPDGATARFNGTSLNIIFYNDKDPVSGRINWTLAHELGHILLKHHDIMSPVLLERRNRNHINTQYDILEMEADWFARTLLCHPYVLDKHGIKTWDEIMTVCNISYSAAINRERDIQTKHYIINTPWDENILLQIEKITMHCIICKHTLKNMHYLFCSICGQKNTLKLGDGIMNYKEYNTNNEGYVERCIRCNNEKIIGNFCHICGSPTRNFCSNYFYNDGFHSCNNSEPLPGNARFCFSCGSASVFMNSKLLCTWKEELDAFEKQKEIDAQASFMNIPEGIDDELPFNTVQSYISIPDGIDDDEELPFN